VPKSTWDPGRYQARHSYVWDHGASLLDLLDPLPGERILDVGCGPGQLTYRIAERGATVIGIDSSPDMIGEARQNFPKLEFRLADATTFEIDPKVDAVFSNAALHWIKNAPAAAARIYAALKPGGRFIAELGGKGNVASVEQAVRDIAGPVEDPWYFPTVGEYATVLEHAGFEVSQATLFDRPTRVEGEDGMDDWLLMFGGVLLAGMEEARRRDIRRAVVERLRPTHYRDSGWTIDYRRLSIVATKPIENIGIR
jgi:trans-aconitate methyltransferase